MGKRRRSHRDLRPETTPGASRIITNIPNPRANARFSDGQRCGWIDERRVMHLGRIAGEPTGDCYVRVRLDDGRIIDLPTFSNCLVHVAEPIPDVELPDEMEVSVSETLERHPLEGNRTPTVESGYYEAVSVEELPEMTEIFDATMPDDHRRTRSGR